MQVEVTHWPRCSQEGGWLLAHPSLHRHEFAPFLVARVRMLGWAVHGLGWPLKTASIST